MVYFLSEDKIKQYLNDGIETEVLNNAIEISQTIFLKQIIGDSLYNKLALLITTGDLTLPENENYKHLLDEYIQPYLIYQSISELVIPITYKIGNVGVFQNIGEGVNSQGLNDVKYIQAHWNNKASFFENRLTTYLQGNTKIFKEYRTNTDVTPSRSTTQQIGIFLGGGITGGRKIIDGTEKNGGSNNIDEKLKNYYTKEEVYNKEEIDTKLDSYTTKEEVDELIENIDLTSYYTKDEVFNKEEINTKLLPYATSNEVNLRLNNYYTKLDVDGLVEDIHVDLSTNYYNKTEVDNIVADNIQVIDLYNASMEVVYDLYTTLKNNTSDKFTGKIITYKGKTLNNYVVSGNNITFSHYAVCTQEADKNTDISFGVLLYPNMAMPTMIVRSYFTIGDGSATVIPSNGVINGMIDNIIDPLYDRIFEIEDTIGNINNILEQI